MIFLFIIKNHYKISKYIHFWNVACQHDKN
nr:MAG TPA: hypothetical protein [Caudoviricetes sp.]